MRATADLWVNRNPNNPTVNVVVTGPGDLRDQRWLDGRIEAIEDGIEAVLDIAREWSDGRNLSRLHPGTSAQDYILGHVQHPLGRGVVVPLLAESNWSNRQIATIAGVSPDTVDRTARNQAVDRPAETLGADGKYRPGRVVRSVVADVIEPGDEPGLDAVDEPGLDAATKPVPRRKKRYAPPWMRHATLWLRRALPEDRDYLRLLNREVRAALVRNGIDPEAEA